MLYAKNQHFHLLILHVVTVSLLFGNRAVGAQSSLDELDEVLRTRIETAGVPPKLSVDDELIYASLSLPAFYEGRAYQLAWSDQAGPTPNSQELVHGIRLAHEEGLVPADYHLRKIETILDEIAENRKKKNMLSQRLVDLDLLLTDAFLIYGSHLLSGRIDPESIDTEWIANPRDADLAQVLEKAISADQVTEALKNLLPPQRGYAQLRSTLAHYKELLANGSWPTVSDGPKLQKGDRDPRVAELGRRLVVTGDLSQDEITTPELFDDGLENGVRSFQRRHGLDVDGTVGPASLAALNTSVTERIHQIEVNLERWRWLPQDLGRRYILVNIADFELEVIEEDLEVLEMRVIVGREYRRTPVFSDLVTYLVLCPYWHLPSSIAIRDKLPAIRKDPGSLRKQNIKLFQGWKADAKELDPRRIDWARVTAKNFSYRPRQEPGPSNALGRVKFMFPNKFSVYLHDTPSRGLFTRTTRTFSAGCLRVEKPLELAEYLLRSDPKWTRETILENINKWQEQTIRLPDPLPVHLLYWTAWVARDGTVHFRDDIYGRDDPLYEELIEGPPGS